MVILPSSTFSHLSLADCRIWNFVKFPRVDAPWHPCTSLLGKMQPTSIYLRCQYFETKFYVKLRKILQFSKMHIPLTQFCFENQWQIIVFLRHPVPCSIWSWSRAKLFPRVSSLSEAHCSFQGCLWSCNGCGAHYISNTNITTNEALKFEILALIVICLPAYLGISEFDTKFWHKL